MNPKFYLVGGAVRDHVLGIQSRDRDYVVVGATPEWMISQGYKQVGASFPVFLHPTTGEEYALARQERKTGPGYHGFETRHDVSVTLEDDLARRDLTINSMARSENGEIIDPYGGLRDLRDGILRHTSDAFVEDPLRVLRVARFAARYGARYGFTVHPDTITLSKKLVDSGELDHLPSERIWIELSKSMDEPNPAKMMQVLHEVGAMDSSLSMYFPDGDLFVEWLDTIFTAMNATGVHLSAQTKFMMCFGGLHIIDREVLVQDLAIPKNLAVMVKHSDVMDTYLMNDDLLDAASALALLNHTKYDALNPSAEHQAIIQSMQIDDSFTKYKTNFRYNLERLKTAYFALKHLDLKEVVDGDKTNVKQRVYEAKLKAIEVVFSMEHK